MSRLQRSMEGTRGRCRCGKAIYPSRGAARRGMLRMIEAGSGDPDNDFRLGIYWCQDCELYHVGHAWGEDDWESRAEMCVAMA